MGTIPIGQGVSVTPMQMLAAYNVIANGGTYVAPRLVDSTIDADGQRASDSPVDEGHRVLSKATADKMNLMLRGVVTEGTGKNGRGRRLHVGGQDRHGPQAAARRRLLRRRTA